MIKWFYKYIYLASLLLLIFPLITSCVVEDLPVMEEEDPNFKVDGDAIKFAITLDEMGGDDGYYNPHKDLESYIDPDKVRVLFFTEDDKFLFESKSRWIKKSAKAEAEGFHTWEVLVPFFTHGNDQVNEYDWDWDLIRKYITTEPFKIAILANRPDREWNMGILKKEASDKVKKDKTFKPLPSDTLVKFGWFGNHGPYWTKDSTLKTDVFALHHCQYDPIYDGKNWDNEGNGTDVGFYDHIAAMYPSNADSKSARIPWMGATSSWVEWGENDNIRTGWNGQPVRTNTAQGAAEQISEWNGVRNAAELTKDHPIPMYGIQLYAPLDTWEEGTTFNLGRQESDYVYDGKVKECQKRQESSEGWRDRAVSLLRSVVKLELVIPDNIDPEYVAICYTNIYARCEPVDTWTPTDEIWADDHDKECEWKYIQNYGPMTYNGAPVDERNPSNNYRDIYTYQKRLSWLYGVWLEKGWEFQSINKGKPVQAPNGDRNFTKNDVVKEDGSNGALNAPAARGPLKYPRIFNPCIQRNNNVHVPEVMRHHDLANRTYHYIVYMGERNVNDPTNLSKMGNTGNGSPTIIYWQVATKSGKIYSFNLNDNPTVNIEDLTYVKNSNKPSQTFPAPPDGSLVGSNAVADGKNTNNKNIEVEVMNGSIQNWPLLRNHVYRIWINGATKPRQSNTRSGSNEPMNLNARGQVFSSPTIDFNNRLFKRPKPDLNGDVKPAEAIFRK